MATIKHFRGAFDVSPKFARAHSHLLSVPHASLETERQFILGMSNVRRLTELERQRLDQVTNVINVHRSLDYFDDVHHTDFGFNYADQLHGNLVTKDCGCQIHYALDHHAFVEQRHVELIPHRSEVHCARHVHLTDVHAHHKALQG